MRTREIIKLVDLHQLPDEHVRLLREQYRFETKGPSLIRDQDYVPGEIDRVRGLLTAESLPVRIFHSVFQEYDAGDYEMADLLNVTFPDAWVTGFSFLETCEVCHAKRRSIDFDRRSRSFRSSAPLLSVNAQFDVVSQVAKETIQGSGLEGADFPVFCEESGYYYLAARRSLGRPVIRSAESLNYRGMCPGCGWPLYDMYFGPLRFERSRWGGEDFVWAQLVEGVVVSHRAWSVLQGMDSRVVLTAPVLLE